MKGANMAGFMNSNTPMTICGVKETAGFDVHSLRKGAFTDAIDTEGKRSGWVGMGELLDTDNFFLAVSDGRFHGFSYRLDTRKPSAAVLKLQLAEKIRQEEASGNKVGAKRRRELREAIMENLLAKSDFAPLLTDCIWDSEQKLLYIASSSEKIVERICSHFKSCFHMDAFAMEAQKDMSVIFSAIQENNGLTAGAFFLQPLGSASLASLDDGAEKSAIAIQNSLESVTEALNQGLAINRISLVATRPDSDEELHFTVATNLQIYGLRLPKPEKDMEDDASFLINAHICANVAGIILDISQN